MALQTKINITVRAWDDIMLQNNKKKKSKPKYSKNENIT